MLSLFTELYFFLIKLITPFYRRAGDFVKNRRTLWQDLKDWRDAHPGAITWFHCASLGEYEMARPLMQRIREMGKAQVLLVTFYSESGYEQRKRDILPDGIFYLPADGIKRPAQFMNIIQPAIAYFVKYDFWPGYMEQIKKRRIPAILINGAFREDQIFFQWYGGGMMKLLKSFAHLFVQYEPSAALLKKHGVDQVTVSGDLRFDRVAQISDNLVDQPLIRKFCQSGFTLIAGSSWPVEEELLANAFGPLEKKGVKLLIVPHDVSENHIRSIELLFTDFHCERLSQAREALLSKYDVMIVDSIGKLAYSYPYAKIALVGGGFSGKLHNILEALVHGVPVMFGPETEKFPEAIYFHRHGLAFEIKSADELSTKVLYLKENPAELAQISALCRKQTASMKGAVNKVFEEIYGGM